MGLAIGAINDQNMKINLEALERDPIIYGLSREIVDMLSHDDSVRSEKDQIGDTTERVAIDRFEPHEPPPSFSKTMSALKKRPCSLDGLKEAWENPFSLTTFKNDTEKLASHHLGEHITIRKNQAFARNPKTKVVTAAYSSPDLVQRNLPKLASIFQASICDNKILSSIIASIYFYRLHPFPDGNGRVSRSMINIALRNYGIISEPKILISVPFFFYVNKFSEYTRGSTEYIAPYVIFFLECMRFSLSGLNMRK